MHPFQQQVHHDNASQKQHQSSKVPGKRDRRASSLSQSKKPNANNNGWGTQEGWGQAWGPSGGESQGWGAGTGGGWGNTAEGVGTSWPATQAAQPDPWGVAGASVSPGGFGARENAPSEKKPQSPSMTQSQSWGGWNIGPQNPEQINLSHDRDIPALVVTSPSTVRAETVAPEKRQGRSLGGLLTRAFRGGKSQKGQVKDQVPAETQNAKRRNTLKKQKLAEPLAEAWPDAVEEEEWQEEDDGEDDYNGESSQNLHTPGQHSTRPNDTGIGWNNAMLPTHSRSYTLAVENRVPPSSLYHNEGPDDTEFNVIDAQGGALAPAQRAFYSRERLARYRIHWAFDPNKDARVSSLLDWIQRMRFDVATHGVSKPSFALLAHLIGLPNNTIHLKLNKFLATRERGALFANADYRPPTSPHEPAFDWLTYNNVQATLDRTMQESLAFYDPDVQIVVFVFLLSKTQNSMAIWRRKLPLPSNLKLAYAPQLKEVISGLQKSYPIHVDECVFIASIIST